MIHTHKPTLCSLTCQIHFDVGGKPEKDQLPGCTEITSRPNTGWNNGTQGMTHYHARKPTVPTRGFPLWGLPTTVRRQATLLGWVTNNYWDTNFRAHNPGRSYSLHPYHGTFEEATAHPWGMKMHIKRGEPSIRYPLTTTRFLPRDDNEHILIQDSSMSILLGNIQRATGNPNHPFSSTSTTPNSLTIQRTSASSHDGSGLTITQILQVVYCSRYSRGVIPVYFLKTVAKYWLLENPSS